MAVPESVKLERERRKTARQEMVSGLISKLASDPLFVSQLALVGGVGGFTLAGKSRLLPRDMAGLLAGLSAVVSCARAGLTDGKVLLAVFAMVEALYIAAVPPREGEEVLQVDPGTGMYDLIKGEITPENVMSVWFPMLAPALMAKQELLG